MHARSIGFDFTGLDDRDLILAERAFLLRPSSVLSAFLRPYMHVVDPRHPYYRPLVTLSYAIDAHWAGMRPCGFHLTNVVLHATATVLFLAVLRRLALGRTVACGAALVFAVHPALASAVAWIPGRNDSVLAVFALGSWLYFLRDLERPRAQHRTLHVALFWLALISKETAVAIPVLCLAHVCLREREGSWGAWRSSSMTIIVLGWAAGIAARFWVSEADRVDPAASFAELARHLPLLARSLGQLLFPLNPSLLGDNDDVPVWPGIVGLLLIAAALRFVPGVRWRVVALGVAVFALFLAPAMAVGGTLILGSRLYLPACGAIVVVAEVVRAAARERITRAVLLGLAVVALGAITLACEGTFRDRRAFARGAVAAAPRSPLAHVCLGQSYQIDGEADRALGEYRSALALGSALIVHNNIAVIHMANARWADAERELDLELAVNPRSAIAYENLAIVLRREDRLGEAAAAEGRARELTSGD